MKFYFNAKEVLHSKKNEQKLTKNSNCYVDFKLDIYVKFIENWSFLLRKKCFKKLLTILKQLLTSDL